MLFRPSSKARVYEEEQFYIFNEKCLLGHYQRFGSGAFCTLSDPVTALGSLDTLCTVMCEEIAARGRQQGTLEGRLIETETALRRCGTPWGQTCSSFLILVTSYLPSFYLVFYAFHCFRCRISSGHCGQGTGVTACTSPHGAFSSRNLNWKKYPGLCPWHRFIDNAERSCVLSFVLVRIDPV
jgi:hypothetical protein